jgi:hypothetical protein
MVRIEHGAWCARSEGDMFTGLGYYGFLGGNSGIASDFAAKYGLADPDCLPWSGGEFNYTFPYSASGDRAGRTVKVRGLREVSGVAAQKTWLDTVGPLVASFDVHSDFSAFYSSGSGVYRRTGNFPRLGIHVVLLIGYDDAAQCWIAKNSHGVRTAHPQAIFRIGFGEVMIDAYAKHGLQGTNPDPATKRRHHAGGLLVSGNGASRRNLEFFAREGAGVRQWFRDPGAPWVRVGDFGAGHPFVASQIASEVCATQTTFNRNFEVVWTTTHRNLQHWVFNQSTKQWHPASPTGFGPHDGDGTPALIQSNFGEPGSLELVVRTVGGQLAHWTRRDSRPWGGVGPGIWVERTRFATNVERSGPALVQTRAGAWPWGEAGDGALQCVCTTTNRRLQHWQWAGGSWSLLEEFAAGVQGAPCVIERMNGATEWEPGFLDLFTVVDGGITHWELQPGSSWSQVSRFGNAVDVLGAAQGHLGLSGTDLVVRTTAGLAHWQVAQVAGGWKHSLVGPLP